MVKVSNPTYYQLGKDGKCITPCPHGVHFDEEDFRLIKETMKEVFPKRKLENVIFVGSGFCEDCDYYNGHNVERQFILCCCDSTSDKIMYL